jgi:hypothetical protein
MSLKIIIFGMVCLMIVMGLVSSCNGPTITDSTGHLPIISNATGNGNTIQPPASIIATMPINTPILTRTVTPIFSKYLIYELKSDDRFFQEGRITPALFSIEYPDTFVWDDRSKPDGISYNAAFFVVQFRYQIYDKNVRQSKLGVIAYPSGYDGFENAQEMYTEFLKVAKTRTSVIDSGMIDIAGIQARHLAYTYQVNDDPFYKPYSAYLENAVFDYDNLIWYVELYWCYQDKIDPSVYEIFPHACDSFKFTK